MIATLATTSLAATIETFFAGMDSRPSDTAVTDLVIDELDQWRNPVHSIASFSKPTFSYVTLGAQQLPVGS